MPKITFISFDKTEYTFDADAGMTAMEVAIKNRIPGIEAECGGACSCATCHLYVDENWLDKTGTASDMEEDMLDFAFDVKDESRLSCQITLTDEMDGIVFHIPEKQF